MNNEKCIWVTSDPISSKVAYNELNKILPDTPKYVSSNQLLIVDHSFWYVDRGRSDDNNILYSWVRAEKGALEKGYSGLCVIGVISWIKRDSWERLVDYEVAVDLLLSLQRILAVCCYPLANLEIDEVVEMVSNHALVIIGHNGRLVAIGNSRRAKICVAKSNDLSYTTIGSKMGISRQRAHQILNGKRKYREMLTDMLISTEAAAQLSIHVNTLRRWSNESLLPVYRIGSRGNRRFKTEDIEKFLAK